MPESKMVTFDLGADKKIEVSWAAAGKGSLLESNLFEEYQKNEQPEDTEARGLYNAAVNGMESLLLACATAGVDIDTREFRESVQTAFDAITNKYEF